MASELELRWLKKDDFKGAAKRFATFCKQDIKTQVDSDDFDLDLDVYQDAIKLVLSKLDHSLTLVELTNKIAAQEESLSSESELDSGSTLDVETTKQEKEKGVDSDAN